MTVDIDSVKTAVALSRKYHHGDLHASLVAAALKIIEEVGPDEFSLRATARRAGVSPAAPAHHFRDTRSLLTALATIGFLELGDALAAATGPDRRSTIVAQCHAYLRFALAKPGLFRLMWRKTALDLEDPRYVAAAKRAFGISDRAVRGDEAVIVSPVDLALAPTIACWSIVHGFVALTIDGAFFAPAAGGSSALDIILDATLEHLNLSPDSLKSLESARIS